MDAHDLYLRSLHPHDEGKTNEKIWGEPVSLQVSYFNGLLDVDLQFDPMDSLYMHRGRWAPSSFISHQNFARISPRSNDFRVKKKKIK
jgi:hypothetical protein